MLHESTWEFIGDFSARPVPRVVRSRGKVAAGRKIRREIFTGESLVAVYRQVGALKT
jgi:hypothetical protein